MRFAKAWPLLFRPGYPLVVTHLGCIERSIHVDENHRSHPRHRRLGACHDYSVRPVAGRAGGDSRRRYVIGLAFPPALRRFASAVLDCVPRRSRTYLGARSTGDRDREALLPVPGHGFQVLAAGPSSEPEDEDEEV